MESLWPILAKIELICQQTQPVSGANPSSGVPERMTGADGVVWLWASYQIRKIAGCACAGNAGNVFPRRRFQRKPIVGDPGMHHGTCVTHVPWCMSGSLTCGDGENVPGIPGACAPAILRIWQEAHVIKGSNVLARGGSIGARWFPVCIGPVIRKAFPCHEVIMYRWFEIINGKTFNFTSLLPCVMTLIGEIITIRVYWEKEICMNTGNDGCRSRFLVML